MAINRPNKLEQQVKSLFAHAQASSPFAPLSTTSSGIKGLIPISKLSPGSNGQVVTTTGGNVVWGNSTSNPSVGTAGVVDVADGSGKWIDSTVSIGLSGTIFGTAATVPVLYGPSTSGGRGITILAENTVDIANGTNPAFIAVGGILGTANPNDISLVGGNNPVSSSGYGNISLAASTGGGGAGVIDIEDSVGVSITTDGLGGLNITTATELNLNSVVTLALIPNASILITDSNGNVTAGTLPTGGNVTLIGAVTGTGVLGSNITTTLTIPASLGNSTATTQPPLTNNPTLSTTAYTDAAVSANNPQLPTQQARQQVQPNKRSYLSQFSSASLYTAARFV